MGVLPVNFVVEWFNDSSVYELIDRKRGRGRGRKRERESRERERERKR